jgi:membrane protease YdiL (CAAX protease family)
MALFGEDFHKARHTWLYDARNPQPLWLALFVFFATFVAYSLLQIKLVQLIGPMMEGGATDPHSPVKAAILSILPAAICAVIMVYVLASLRGGDAWSATALRWPRLGILGWVAVVLGFLVIMYAVIVVIVVAFQIDMAQYTPGANGESPDTGSAGLVKEAMYDLANEPLLYWIAIPSVALGAPLVEEFLFRGPLFAALTQTRLGRWGTVVLTSAGWSLMHMTEPYFSIALIFLMGLVLGGLLLRFGSLWVTMACHGAWNFVFSLITLGLAGQAS